MLYAKEATREGDWPAVPERDRTSRLREVYWMRRADLKSSGGAFVNFYLHWRPDRRELGRTGHDPGDGFIYLVDMMPSMTDRFEWLEVTEAFTTVPAREIERAMRAWNGIPDRNPVDFAEFRSSLRLTRPRRAEQRRAADKVIERIEKKLAKASYGELVRKYGYGTLVVGLPLWFATPPNNPFRAENAVDDFVTRTLLGLEDVKSRLLTRRDCPFWKVIVLWDTTPQALRAWLMSRSTEYEDAANATLINPFGILPMSVLPDSLERALAKTATPESEAPSMNMYLSVGTRKKAKVAGPFPELVMAMRQFVIDCSRKGLYVGARLKWRAALRLWQVLCLLRVQGARGFERWIARKFSVSPVWRVKATRRKARRFYRESKGRPHGS